MLRFLAVCVLLLATGSTGALLAARRPIPTVPADLVGIALVFSGDISDFGYTYTFDQGRIYIQNYFGRRKVLTTYVPGVPFDVDFTAPSRECKAVVTDLRNKGYRLLIAPSLFTFCFRWAHDQYSDMYFLLDSGPHPPQYSRISSGTIRDYEARYTSGIIAGAMSQTGRVGFIAPFNERRQTRRVVATYLGARLANPKVEIYASDVQGYDNVTLQIEAAKTLIDDYNCDVITTFVNPLGVHFYVKERNLTSIFSDGDGRILVGESILTSIVYSRVPMFMSVAERVIAGNWTRIDYSGGYSDGAVSLAAFGDAYFERPEVRQLAEPLLERAVALLKNSSSGFTGFCGVSALGLTPETSTDCLSTETINAWPYNFTALPEAFSNIKYVGTAVVELAEIYVKYSDGLAIAFVVISIVILMCILVLLFFTYIAAHKQASAMQYASPPFMYVILLGAALVCVAVITSNSPTDITCNITLWFVVVGINIMYGAVFAKAGRLWWILRSAKKMRRVSLPNKTLFLVLSVQLMSIMIILVLGTSLSPYQRVMIRSPDLPANSAYVRCAASPTSLWPIALVVYQGLLVMVGIFFAFKTRHFLDELNESREIALIIYNLLFIGIIMILLLYLANLTPAGMYAMQAVAMLWIAATTLGILYIPKLYSTFTGRSFHDATPPAPLGAPQTLMSSEKSGADSNRTRVTIASALSDDAYSTIGS